MEAAHWKPTCGCHTGLHTAAVTIVTCMAIEDDDFGVRKKQFDDIVGTGSSHAVR